MHLYIQMRKPIHSAFHGTDGFLLVEALPQAPVNAVFQTAATQFWRIAEEYIRNDKRECVENCFRDAGILKKYLLAVLYNASVTMGSYYSALVQHDLAESG